MVWCDIQGTGVGWACTRNGRLRPQMDEQQAACVHSRRSECTCAPLDCSKGSSCPQRGLTPQARLQLHVWCLRSLLPAPPPCMTSSKACKHLERFRHDLDPAPRRGQTHRAHFVISPPPLRPSYPPWQCPPALCQAHALAPGLAPLPPPSAPQSAVAVCRATCTGAVCPHTLPPARLAVSASAIGAGPPHTTIARDAHRNPCPRALTLI